MAQNFNYGGQAVMEGVMMRGSRGMAVAVRAPNHEIVVYEEPITSPLYTGVLSRIPFVRGLGLLWDSLGLGMRALMYSARVSVGDDAEFGGPIAWGTMALSLVFFVGLFFVAPRLVAEGVVQGLVAQARSGQWLWLGAPLFGNLLEGLLRLGLVIGYIWAIGRLPEIERVFAYHGAEHKTINAYEAGAPLTPESVAKFPLEHPRCGTGFLLIVVVLSVVVFSLIGNPPLLIRLAARVALVPVIATIAYEYIRLMARRLNSPIVRTLIVPQLALQRLTTREPSSDMLEVGIAALQRVLEAERLPAPAAQPAASPAK